MTPIIAHAQQQLTCLSARLNRRHISWEQGHQLARNDDLVTKRHQRMTFPVKNLMFQRTFIDARVQGVCTWSLG